MSAGRAGERERFVRDFLRHHGARITGPPHGPFTAELPQTLARRLGAKEVELAFRVQDLSEHPGARLMVPGNALFDRILRLARRGGFVSLRYLQPDRTREPRDWLPADGPLASTLLNPPVYRRRLLFTFRIAYRAFEGFDEIRSIVVNPTSGRAEDGREFFRDRNLSDAPEPGIVPAPAVDVAAALQAAVAELERRTAANVARFTQRAERELQTETERLREFYLALIAEEKTRREGGGAKPAIAATGCKVEWVERVDREIRLFAPRVIVSLLGLEEMWVPVCPLAVGDGEINGEIDLSSGEILGLACQACGIKLHPAGHLQACDRGHWLCGKCLTRCPDCGGSFCLRCSHPQAVAADDDRCYALPSRNSAPGGICPACAPAAGGS